MIKINRRIIVIVALVLSFVIVCASVLVLIKNKNKTAESENEQVASTVLPKEDISDIENVNVFALKKITSDKNTVTVQLTLSGNISICQYSITLQYDDNCLKLKDYDADLSVYSPVVYPGKNDDGRIMEIPEDGIVNLVWANAENISKEAEVITLVFDKTEQFSDSTQLLVNVKSASVFKDGEVLKTKYNSNGLLLETD